MVGIHPHEERAAVRVPEPRRDGRDIHTGLDGGRGEGVAQIMMRQQLDAESFAGRGEGLPRLAHRQDLALGVNQRNTVNGHAGGVLAAGVEFFQERSGCGNQRNLAVGRFGLAAVDLQYAAFEIYVGPGHALRFAEPATRIGEETTEIRRIARRSAAGARYLGDDLGEIGGFRQIPLPPGVLSVPEGRANFSVWLASQLQARTVVSSMRN